jgi:RNA polymerase sigma-70 factor (ECF subfamily)
LVYRNRFNQFCSVANAILDDRERAKDAVQDAFASALRHKRQWRRQGSIDSWLWRAVVNAAYDQRRKPGKVVMQAAAENAYERVALLDSAGGGRVTEALSALPERQRLVLFLRYYGDLEYERIAQILDLKPGTVAATIHQAQQNMKRRLEVAVDE